MFINKKAITSLPSVISSSARRMPFPPIALDATLPFKTNNDMDKLVFNSLMQKVFSKLEDRNDKHFLNDIEWMYGFFKKRLEDQDTPLYNAVYSMVKSFYKYYPFDTLEHLSLIMSDFFKKWKIGNVYENKTWALIIDSKNGTVKLINSHFSDLFKNTIKNKTIDKIGVEYTEFTKMFRELLKLKVENKVRTSDLEFRWEKYTLLKTWIDNFDYESLKSIKEQTIYDQYFSSPKRINLSEMDYKQILNTFLDNNLNSSEKKLMQVVHYYIFEDLTANHIFQDLKVETTTYNEANKLVDDITNNNNPLESLKVLLPSISRIISKYNLYWKSDESENGLVIHQKIGQDFLALDSTDATKTTYRLKFVFRFITNSVKESITGVNYSDDHIIEIYPVKKIIPAFDKAKNVIMDFKNIVEWNPGYKSDSSERWTEKDMVDWISGFTNYSDIMNKISSANSDPWADKVTILSDRANDWANFSPTDIDLLILSLTSINDFQYRFSARPFIKFIKNPDGVFGDVEIYVTLIQIDKKTSTIVRYEDIRIKSQSKILSIIDVIRNSMSLSFPFEPYFDENQMEHFWLNGFLEQNQNLSSSLNLEYIKDKSNLSEMHIRLSELKNEIDRDYFKNSHTLSISYGMTIFGVDFINNFYSKNDGESHFLRLYLKLIDNRFDDSSISYIIEKKFKEMKLFGEITAGPFEGWLGSEWIYLNSLKLMILLDGTQQVPSIGEELPTNFKFRNTDNNEIVSLEEIKNKLIELGFKNVDFSSVKKFPLEKIGIAIKYQVDYYDFINGDVKTVNLVYDLIIEFDNVPPEVIQESYDNIIESLNPNQKLSEKLLKSIDDNFSSLKDFETDSWRNNVGKEEYNDVIKSVLELIKSFIVNEDVINELKDLYNDNIPFDILSKLKNPEYVNVIREILKWKSDFPKLKLKEIIENHNFIETLKKIKFNQIKNVIRNFLKITNKTKYVYFSSGIGLGLSGVIAGLSSLRWLRLNAKTKKVSTSFKKSKYISVFSAFVSLIAIGGSVALTLIFFLLKGGF